jgi:carboxyl-terminal processing protease
MTERPPYSVKRIQIALPLLLFSTLALGVGLGFLFARPEYAPGPSGYDPDGHDRLEELLRYIEARYVDKADRKELVDDAITSILKQLDPHSAYIPKEDLEAVTQQLEGEFEGIGVEFMFLRDTPVVVAAISGGPAERAGIRAGDKIIAIGDSIVAGAVRSTRTPVELLRGQEGSSVEIGILRFPSPTIRRFRLKREKIPLKSIDASYLINKRTAYIRISRFSATTDKEFMGALEKMSAGQRELDLILDLRQNPGGYLQQASNILSQLFEERNQLLVYTEGTAAKRAEYRSTGRAYFPIGKIAVLIDEQSASASEIIAGAIQDHDRGLVIGRRSFGKGLVQEQYPLRDGSALRLSIARYYTPSGRSIQKPYQGRDDYEEELDRRMASGELRSLDKLELEDSTLYFTDNGRVVYGSGGILPDIFVPIDSQWLSPVYQGLQLLFPEFALMLIQKNRALFPGSVDRYAADFVWSDSLSNEFLRYANQNGAMLSDNAYQSLRRAIDPQLKSQVARHLFGLEAYYQVSNQGDPVVRVALEKIEREGPLRELYGDLSKKRRPWKD